MENKGSLSMATEERLKRWFRKEVICNVEIWNEEDNKKLVIITNLKNSKPLAITNNFKKIASAIKEKHLKDVAENNISWCESACWDDLTTIYTVKEIII